MAGKYSFARRAADPVLDRRARLSTLLLGRQAEEGGGLSGRVEAMEREVGGEMAGNPLANARYGIKQCTVVPQIGMAIDVLIDFPAQALTLGFERASH